MPKFSDIKQKPKPKVETPKGRFSDEDIQLMKQTFSNRDDLLQSLRNLFLGFELTDAEKVGLKELRTPQIKALLKKVLYPEFSPIAPIGTSVDIWMYLKEDPVDHSFINVGAFKRQIQLVKTALALFSGETNEKIDLTIDLDDAGNIDEVWLQARNGYMGYIESQMKAIKIMAQDNIEAGFNPNDSNK